MAADANKHRFHTSFYFLHPLAGGVPPLGGEGGVRWLVRPDQ